MGGPVPAVAGRLAPWKWGVVWLLFLATVINYMDRQTYTALSGPIKTAFTSDQSVAGLDGMFEKEPRADGKRHLSEGGYGDIEFAFGITFAISQFVAGYMVDRGSLRWLYAAALLLWSGAGFCTGLATTVEALIVCRVVLAMGEGFNWPCAVTGVQRLMPREQRSLANGIFHSGASIGAILTPLLVLVMVQKNGTGWQTVFLVIGAGGALWAFLWLAFLRGERGAVIDRQTDDAGGTGHDASPGPEESFWRIFTRRYIWITIGVGLAVNICWHFCRVWLPRYLDRDLGFNFKGDDTLYATFSLPWGHWAMTPADVGLLIQSGFYICADFGSLLAGYVTRKIIHAGWPVERARKAVQLGTALLCLLAIPAVALGKLGYPWVAVGLLFIVAAGAMGGFANYFSLTQEVSPRHTAQVLGFTGASAWFAVAALHPIAGRIADNIGTFVPLFQVIVCVPLVGAFIGLLWPRHKAAAGE
jgi:ACS family hexuronate transporter-like MFS transporter